MDEVWVGQRILVVNIHGKFSSGTDAIINQGGSRVKRLFTAATLTNMFTTLYLQVL